MAKYLTLEELESSFVNNQNDWVWTVEQTVSEFNERSFCEDDERVIFESWVSGYAVAQNLKRKIIIRFSWVANGGQDTYDDAHNFEITIDENTEFEVKGFTFVDDEGDDITVSDVRSELYDLLNGREWSNQVFGLLPTAECEEIDNDEGEEMEEFEVIRDKEQNLKFKGELIASSHSSDNHAMGSSYSGSTGRWTELRLYKTAGGKFICSSIGRTRWQGERDRFAGCVCENTDEAIAFFGNGWLAKELYEAANIDASLIIE